MSVLSPNGQIVNQKLRINSDRSPSMDSVKTDEDSVNKVADEEKNEESNIENDVF
jgi:hypothetical protein